MDSECAFCGDSTKTLKVTDENQKEIIFCDWPCLRSYLLLKTR